ncbi:MAG TPA: hypoxanthine phosphoribosyltransferase [Nitrospirota bacterium]|nr:hypoxanthine phosphoribosyltransferase [Nitrospirota bacterium]
MTELQEILFDEQAIAGKVRELAGQISHDYAGKELVLIGILKGAVMFAADLMRSISLPVIVEFIQATSYGNGTISSRTVAVKKEIHTGIKGKHVLLVDTIIDTGETMDCLLKKFSEKGPASLKVVALLDKKCRRTVEVPVAYRGFEVPDTFVVGYGMDHAEQYRNLPYIAAIKTTE